MYEQYIYELNKYWYILIGNLIKKIYIFFVVVCAGRIFQIHVQNSNYKFSKT